MREKFRNFVIQIMKNLVIIMLVLPLSIVAQITFPKGNTLNLVTGTETLYSETAIPFHTGKNKITDYDWEKVYDSVDTRWDVAGCMNGECRADLPQQGSFIQGIGSPDSSGYIMFHVSSHYNNGQSVIKYRVYNRNDSTDQGILTYNINYNRALLTEQAQNEPVRVYPNPSNGIINIKGKGLREVAVIDLNGKQVACETVKQDGGDIAIETPDYTPGIYLVKITLTSGECLTKKMAINL